MGLFGGSKTYVGTSISRVLEENQYPATLKESVIRAVMRGTSVSEEITEGLLNGPALKVDRYFNYGRDHYPYGLPNQTYINSGEGAEVAQDFIRTLYTNPLVFEYVRLEALDFTHVGWQHLYDNLGYVFETNEIQSLTEEKGTPVYLDNIKAYHYLPPAVEPTDAEPYPGTVHNSFSPSPTGGYTPERRGQDINDIWRQALATDFEIIDQGEDHVRIFYVYEASGNLVREFIELPLTAYDLDADYFHAMFREATPEGDVTRFFTYRKGAGTYPALDGAGDPNYVNTGRFFPFLFFRKFHQNLVDSSLHDTELYQASERMAKYLNIDYQAFGEAIHESPDIDDVRHAVLMMAVPANSDDPYELRYLYDFFKRVHAQDRDNGDRYINKHRLPWMANRGRVAYVPKAVAIEDGGFKMALGFQEIRKKTRKGYLGKVGTVTRTQGKTEVVRVVNEYNDYGVFQRTNRITNMLPYQRYTKQINPFFVEEITVVNLTLRYDVYKSYDVVAEAHDDKLLIPIDRDITDQYNLSEKEQIYYRSLHMVYNSKVKKDVAWYESGFFKFVMIVAAVAITIWSGGATAGFLAAAWANGIMAFAMAVLQTIALSLVINYAFKLVVKELGMEAAMVLAIASMAISGGMRLTNTQSFMGLSAEKFMMAASGFGKGVQGVAGDELAKYSSEQESFNLMVQEKTEELDVAKDLLEMDGLVDPFEFVGMRPFTLFGESPDDFYNRTTHSGNIGTVVYEHIHNYVDINLQLPDFNKTMGELV